MWTEVNSTATAYFLTISSSRKYPYSLHRMDWNFPGVVEGRGWLCKTKTFEEMYM